MSAFNDVLSITSGIDVSKRVNYVLGMILGQNEFLQDQLYFLNRDNLHHRILHGYGTVSGLQVHLRDNNEGPEVLIEPGYAIDPLGRIICVSPTQCASLNGWISTNADDLDLQPGSPPNSSTLRIYIALCYRECATDVEPIPGRPCRTEAETQAATRLQDGFRLEFRTSPPAQVEEDGIRELCDLLANIEIGAAGDTFTTREALIELVRLLAEPPASPGPGTVAILLDPATAREDLRAALLAWVSEIRPLLLPKDPQNPQGQSNESCVLLAELDMIVNDDLTVDLGNINIIEDERPYLLSSRVLQALMLCREPTTATGGQGGFLSLVTEQPPDAIEGAERAGTATLQPIAAGHFHLDDTIDASSREVALAGDGPVFNGMTATLVREIGVARRVRIHFDGFRTPDGSFTYLVNGMIHSSGGTSPVHSLEFVEFEENDGGILVQISSITNTAGFMIQISRIESA